MNKELVLLLINLPLDQNQIDSIINLFNKKQVLTPPTADEVCKALSEYYYKEVKYSNRTFFIVEDGKWSMIVINRLMESPHLIILLGRFYESLVS